MFFIEECSDAASDAERRNRDFDQPSGGFGGLPFLLGPSVFVFFEESEQTFPSSILTQNVFKVYNCHRFHPLGRFPWGFFSGELPAENVPKCYTVVDFRAFRTIGARISITNFEPKCVYNCHQFHAVWAMSLGTPLQRPSGRKGAKMEYCHRFSCF